MINDYQKSESAERGGNHTVSLVRDSLLTIGLAILLGGLLAVAFVPGIKEAVWPTFKVLFTVFC